MKEGALVVLHGGPVQLPLKLTGCAEKLCQVVVPHHKQPDMQLNLAHWTGG